MAVSRSGGPVNLSLGGSYPERGRKTAVLLDAARVLGKLHFLYGDDATIRSLRSRARSRLPAA